MYKSEKLYYKDFEEIVSFVGSKAAELFRSGLPENLLSHYSDMEYLVRFPPPALIKIWTLTNLGNVALYSYFLIRISLQPDSVNLSNFDHWTQLDCSSRNSKYEVNALLHKGFSNPYQSRYDSVSLYYQCQNPDTIS